MTAGDFPDPWLPPDGSRKRSGHVRPRGRLLMKDSGPPAGSLSKRPSIGVGHEFPRQRNNLRLIIGRKLFCKGVTIAPGLIALCGCSFRVETAESSSNASPGVGGIYQRKVLVGRANLTRCLVFQFSK